MSSSFGRISIAQYIIYLRRLVSRYIIIIIIINAAGNVTGSSFYTVFKFDGTRIHRYTRTCVTLRARALLADSSTIFISYFFFFTYIAYSSFEKKMNKK